MSRIYVGNLPTDVRESELDDLFYKYGRIKEIDVKTPARPPAFAFIQYEDPHDAEDAVRGRDGYNFGGHRLRCEVAKSDRDRRDPRDDRRAGDRPGDRRDERPKKAGGRRTEHSVIVTNLPRGCSWQDLKDLMRKAGDVVYTDVDKYGDGIVDFSNRSDMEYAVKSLDDTEFKHHSGPSYIRVKFANKDSGRDEDRGREKSRSRSPDRARSRSRDRSRSASRSRDRKHSSRSPSRSRSPSPKRDRDSAHHVDDVPRESAAEGAPETVAPVAAEN